MFMKFSSIVASGFGVGYIPKAPGTFGSVLGLVISLLVYYIKPSALKFFVYVAFWLGVLVTYTVIKASHDKDPKFVVIDEIVGMGLTLLISFKILGNLSFFTVLLSFVCFRLFDIWKPWPIGAVESYCEKSEKLAAIGVMIDDILAALYASAVILILSLVLSEEIFLPYRIADV